MRNIELKARLHDREKAIAVCDALGAAPQGDIRQEDTYFNVPQGRLKLRVSDPGFDYLVFYSRPDMAQARACDYHIAVVPRTVGDVLRPALGVHTIVRKVRTLYLWENVRIHLDHVEDLGEFIEFEAVLSDKMKDEDGYRKLAILCERFGVQKADIAKGSYADLQEAKDDG